MMPKWFMVQPFRFTAAIEISAAAYACPWLGVIAVPLNTRLSAAEIDHVLADASPRGLIRHSLMPVPTRELSWQRVLDKEPFEIQNDSGPEPVYDPQAVLRQFCSH
jgi:acyl-CoA synthetase (AMP-forming)/AMP-acid ligase II